MYDSEGDKLKHIQKVECKNRSGKFSKGHKVRGIEFMDPILMKNCVMVTTNDSRIRFVNIKSGEVLLKMKGHKNEHFMIRASMSADFNHAICASEDDSTIFLWNNLKQQVIESSKRGLFGKVFNQNKIKEYEYFSLAQQQHTTNLSN